MGPFGPAARACLPHRPGRGARGFRRGRQGRRARKELPERLRANGDRRAAGRARPSQSVCPIAELAVAATLVANPPIGVAGAGRRSCCCSPSAASSCAARAARAVPCACFGAVRSDTTNRGPAAIVRNGLLVALARARHRCDRRRPPRSGRAVVNPGRRRPSPVAADRSRSLTARGVDARAPPTSAATRRCGADRRGDGRPTVAGRDRRACTARAGRPGPSVSSSPTSRATDVGPRRFQRPQHAPQPAR